MELFCFILFYMAKISSVTSVVKIDVQARGFAAFEETIIAKVLTGYLIKSSIVGSRDGCVLLCNRISNCRSVNFCGRRTCHLLSQDIFSTEEGEGVLSDDNSCTYVGMQNSEIPKCQEEGFFVDIKDDNRNGICNINGKRVDLEWGEWGETTAATDSSVEFIGVQKRTPETEAAHGGIAAGESEKTVEWLRWVKQLKTWEEARDNCVQLGGKLFFKVDGTKDQLDFLYNKLDQQNHWLGIFTTDHKTWIDVEGSVVEESLLLWDPNNAFDNKGSQYHVSNFKKDSSNYLNDVNKGLELASVCDMLQ